MAIRVQRHANVSKQATLLDGLNVSPLKWRVCGCGLNRFVHEGMNHISNVKVHLKTRSWNVNIAYCVHWNWIRNCISRSHILASFLLKPPIAPNKNIRGRPNYSNKFVNKKGINKLKVDVYMEAQSFLVVLENKTEKIQTRGPPFPPKLHFSTILIQYTKLPNRCYR